MHSIRDQQMGEIANLGLSRSQTDETYKRADEEHRKRKHLKIHKHNVPKLQYKNIRLTHNTAKGQFFLLFAPH